MKLPQIGDTITTEKALELCKYLGLDYLVKRIETNPDAYKEWVFDGCSMIPDALLCEDITFKCCLPHDLKYAYGKPGSMGDAEREKADNQFYNDLVLKAKTPIFIARIFHASVRSFGIECLSTDFSWAFASK